MAGGMYSKKGPGIPIGVRAGHPEDPSMRPWEHMAPEFVQPRHRHVLVDVAGAWAEGLVIGLRRDPHEWAVHVAHVLPGGNLHTEWLPASRVRSIHIARN